MKSLDPRWAGGRPRLISPDDEQFTVTTANTRPEALGRPFTRWSIRKLADHPSAILAEFALTARFACRTGPPD